MKEQINPNIRQKIPLKQFTLVNKSSSIDDSTFVQNNAQALADLKTDVDKLSDTDPVMAAHINEGLSRLTALQN